MNKNRKYSLVVAKEYEEWFEDQTAREKTQIAARLMRIELSGHFGDNKYLNHDVWELRWKSGRRIYYAYLAVKNILLILGGNKNGQGKDIAKAKKILRRETGAEA